MKAILHKVTAVFLAALICFSSMPLAALAEVVMEASVGFSLMRQTAITSLDLNPMSAVLTTAEGNNKTQLTATLTGGASNDVTANSSWTSSNTNVATVNEHGLVTAVGKGKATITCEYKTGVDVLSMNAVITVTDATFNLVYSSNYPDDAMKYAYQNGSTATIAAANNTNVTETYAPNTSATLLDNVFSTINYDFTGYLDSDGKTYKPGESVNMTSNLTLSAQWKSNGNSTEKTQIRVRYYQNNKQSFKEKKVSATLTNANEQTATVTFITDNNQDTIVWNHKGFYGWKINGEIYNFNEQVTTKAEKAADSDLWLVHAYPEVSEDNDMAQFFVRKASAEGFGIASLYYSVGIGTIDTKDFDDKIGTKAGADNTSENVNDRVITPPSPAQIANLMNITLDEASSVRWYVIKRQNDGYHVDGVIYTKDKYHRADFIDPDNNKIVQTILVENGSQLDPKEAEEGNRLKTDLRTFKHWSRTPNGDEVDLAKLGLFAEDIKLYAVFDYKAGYTIRYLEEGTDTELLVAENEESTVGSEIQVGSITKPDITGYTYKSADPGESLTVSNTTSDNVIKLYYAPNTHSITYQFTGDIIPPAYAELENNIYKHTETAFGKAQTREEAPTVQGYTFNGWTLKEPTTLSVSDEGTFTMPDADVVFEGSWTENSVIITYKVKQVDNAATAGQVGLASGGSYNSTQVAETFIPSGGAPGGASAKVIDTYNKRYVFVGWYLGEPSEVNKNNTPLSTDPSFIPKLDDVSGATEWQDRTYTACFTKILVRVHYYKDSVAPGNHLGAVALGDTYPNNTHTPMQIGSIITLINGNASGDLGHGKYIGEGLKLGSAYGNGVQVDGPYTVIATPDEQIINVVYKKNAFEVRYEYTGVVPQGASELPTAKSYTAGEVVTVEPAATAPQYSFSGWTTAGATVSNGSFTMPENAVVFTGSFTQTDASFKVEYYLQDPVTKSFVRKDNETTEAYGPIGQYVDVGQDAYKYLIKSFDSLGYERAFPQGQFIHGGTVTADGSLTLKLYYRLKQFGVSYTYEQSSQLKDTNLLPANKSYQYLDTVTVEPDLNVPGYTFTGWHTDSKETVTPVTDSTSTFTMPMKWFQLYGRFEKNADAAYTVQHYQQNLERNGYTLTDIDHLSGTWGLEAAYAPKTTYTGFIYQSTSTTWEDSAHATPSTAALSIAQDGSLVIKLYYTRITNSVYYVRHYQQQLDGTFTEVTADAQTQNDGVFGAEVTAAGFDKQYAGFTYDLSVTDAVNSIIIGGEPTDQTLKLYYTRNAYTLTVNYWYDRVGGTQAALSYNASHLFGDSYNVASPRLVGYTPNLLNAIGVISDNTTVQVVYTMNAYRLTVRYRYMDGTVAAADYVAQNLRYDQPYEVDTPSLTGYTANTARVSGRMPDGDVEVTVYFAATPTPPPPPAVVPGGDPTGDAAVVAAEPAPVFVLIDEYGIPLGLGNVVMNVGDCFE